MPLISASECATVLKPYHQQIRAIFLDAWDLYKRILEIAPCLSDYKRGRANDVHAAVKANARKTFGDAESEAYFIPHQPESFMIVFGKRLFTKFKKLDRETLRPSNVSTDQNDEMIRQMPLPQHGPDPVYPVAGYVLNDIETMIESVHVVLPLGDYNLWSYEITREGAADNVIEMPTIWPVDQLTKTVVKPRRQITPKENTNDDEVS